MVFSGIPFLYCFFPGTLLAYFLVPRKLKNAVLFVLSLLFYAWGEPRMVAVMLGSIVWSYALALPMERRRNSAAGRLLLVLSVGGSLGCLIFFKYADFLLQTLNSLAGLSLPLPGIALPIGISFYTFQLLSYSVDVYRGEVRAQRSFIDLGAYIAMFPQLIAGPIVRYADVEQQLRRRTHSVEKTALGIRRFTLGLGKKVLLANQLALLSAQMSAAQEPSLLSAWLYAAALVLQIYFDFSGYSDMAIGLGHIFGFTYLENFHYPLTAASVTDFWRRWHMSLGSWFRD